MKKLLIQLLKAIKYIDNPAKLAKIIDRINLEYSRLTYTKIKNDGTIKNAQI